MSAPHPPRIDRRTEQRAMTMHQREIPRETGIVRRIAGNGGAIR
jgi:hypothetical protein